MYIAISLSQQSSFVLVTWTAKIAANKFRRKHIKYLPHLAWFVTVLRPSPFFCTLSWKIAAAHIIHQICSILDGMLDWYCQWQRAHPVKEPQIAQIILFLTMDQETSQAENPSQADKVVTDQLEQAGFSGRPQWSYPPFRRPSWT